MSDFKWPKLNMRPTTTIIVFFVVVVVITNKQTIIIKTSKRTKGEQNYSISKYIRGYASLGHWTLYPTYHPV